MSKPLAMLAIGLCLGGGVGFVAALSTGAEMPGHAHDAAGHGDAGDHDMAMAHDHAAHGHADRDAASTVEAAAPVPVIAGALTPDPHGGWNLHLKVDNFRFAPEDANGPAIDGEGHAHAFADGDKVARLYGPWMHFAHLPESASTLTITLNANDHRTLTANGAPVSVSLPIPR